MRSFLMFEESFWLVLDELYMGCEAISGLSLWLATGPGEKNLARTCWGLRLLALFGLLGILMRNLEDFP